MPVQVTTFNIIIKALESKNVTLVAVSKTKPAEDIKELYNLGQRDFGENYVQELITKQAALPQDIRWHFIGHLQSNKVKNIIPLVHLIHGVDSYKLLTEINKQSLKQNRVTQCLLQVHIAREETKFGLDENELTATFQHYREGMLKNVRIRGLMGMASFTEDEQLIRNEFAYLKSLLDKSKVLISDMDILSMGMSSDYNIAIAEGSNMVRIGSLLFGARTTAQ